MEEGKGWWWAQGDDVKTEVGADLGVLWVLNSHTTTQPSSIEEEGSGECPIDMLIILRPSWFGPGDDDQGRMIEPPS